MLTNINSVNQTLSQILNIGNVVFSQISNFGNILGNLRNNVSNVLNSVNGIITSAENVVNNIFSCGDVGNFYQNQVQQNVCLNMLSYSAIVCISCFCTAVLMALLYPFLLEATKRVGNLEREIDIDYNKNQPLPDQKLNNNNNNVTNNYYISVQKDQQQPPFIQNLPPLNLNQQTDQQPSLTEPPIQFEPPPVLEPPPPPQISVNDDKIGEVGKDDLEDEIFGKKK